MTERDYSGRDVLDKLGVRPGQAVALEGELEPELRRRVLERVDRAPAGAAEALDLVIAAADASTDAVALLLRWKRRLQPAGCVWLLTPKRGFPGYVNHKDLIACGLAAGLVDNKICSVSDTTSGMRFVIRRADRPRHRGTIK